MASTAGSVTADPAPAPAPAPAPPLAQTAVSLRKNGKSKSGNTNTVALSNWDELKARSVDTWASGLLPDSLERPEASTMRIGIGRYCVSLGEGHRESNDVYTGRQEAHALEHPNLHLWSKETGKDERQAKVGGRGRGTDKGTAQGEAQAPNPTHPPRGLPNSIPSRFANTLSQSSQRREGSKASSTPSEVPVLVVPYTPPPPSQHPSAPPSVVSHASHTSRFSFSSFSPPRIPKSIYKMRSSGPPPSLPPVAEFDIGHIMEWAKHDDEATGIKGVSGDLERIAEICKRSRLSLANQYERHMKPHGVVAAEGEVGEREWEEQGEQGRKGMGRKRMGMGKGRRGAFETLETIYASSSSGGSSNDGQGRQKSAMKLAAQVKHRNEADGHTTQADEDREREGASDADHERSITEGRGGRTHIRREGLIVGRHVHAGKDGDGKRRKRLEALVIDTASSQDGSQASSQPLRSKPLKPRTSRVVMGGDTMVQAGSVLELLRGGDSMAPHETHIQIATLGPEMAILPNLQENPRGEQQPGTSQSVLGSFSSWLPWLGRPQASVEAVAAEVFTETYCEILPSAEGSLKRLLDVSEKRRRRSGGRGREAG